MIELLVISMVVLFISMVILSIHNAVEVKNIADNKTLTSREKIDILKDRGFVD